MEDVGGNEGRRVADISCENFMAKYCLRTDKKSQSHSIYSLQYDITLKPTEPCEGFRRRLTALRM